VNIQVKELAGRELGKLLPILNQNDRAEQILATILRMAHDEEDEMARIISI
jgi:hypothetical protein